MASTKSTSELLGPSAVETVNVAGTEIRVHAHPDGTMTVLDYTAPAGFPGPPLHFHPAYDELFYVLGGTPSFRLGDEASVAAPGSVVRVNGSEPHTFANLASEPARMLIICTPGGFEHYLREMATLASPTPADLGALAERHGIHLA